MSVLTLTDVHCLAKVKSFLETPGTVVKQELLTV